MGRSKPKVAALALALTVIAACVEHPVGPARTFGAYEGKAVTTAESALSAVATAQLMATTASAGNSFGPYTAAVLGESESAVDAVQGTFGSIQPPDARADALRRELDDILDTAGTHLGDLRIAARRGHIDELAALARPLDADAAALQGFIERHG